MLAVLAVAPEAAITGFPAATIVAAGITALVALGWMVVLLHRSARLTVVRGVLSASLALGVVAVAAAGVLALSPASAQAAPKVANSYVVVEHEEWDIQLPTLAD